MGAPIQERPSVLTSMRTPRRDDRSRSSVSRHASLAVSLALVVTTLSSAALGAEGQLATPSLQKAAIKCQKVIAKVTAKAFTAKLKVLDVCGNAALACVQTKQAKADCFLKAGRACGKKLSAAAATTASAKAKGKIVAANSCARDIPFLDLLGPDGLGLESLTEPCFRDFGLNVCGGVDGLAECLVRTHERAAGLIYEAARPRMGELLARLAGTTLAPIDGLTVLGDCTKTNQCPLSSPDAEGVERCGRAITKATHGLVAGVELQFGTCAQGVLACMQRDPADPGCLTKAQAGCDKAAKKVATGLAKFSVAITKSCGDAVVSFPDLSSPSGLNLSALACASPSTDAATLAECLRLRVQPVVATLVQQAVARVGEFGADGRLGELCPSLGSTCPSTAVGGSAASARATFFGSITKLIKFIRRPVVDLIGTTKPGGRPAPGPGVGSRVTIVGQPPRVRFGGISKIPFRYTIGRRSSQPRLGEDPPSLIVVVRRQGVIVEDHLEIELDAAKGEDLLEVAYQDALPDCAFSLELALRDGGVVSDYTSVPQVVEAAPAPSGGQGRRLKTGQTLCFNTTNFIGGAPCAGTGQDAEFQAGAARNYVDNGDGTITDATTGLMWEKLSDDGGLHDTDDVYTWANAFSDKIATLNATNFAGHADWRLPNINELQTLSKYDSSEPSIDGVFKTACTAGCSTATCSCASTAGYWSATTVAAVPSNAWLGGWAHGFMSSRAKSGANKVRAVRDDSASPAPAGKIVKTGQTACFDGAGAGIPCAGTGQDGELQTGLARNYVDNGDGTITDATTGLMWEKLSDDNGIHDKDHGYVWANAMRVKIQTLNGSNFAGHGDWRLPNVNELQSLASYGLGSPAVAPAFNTNCAPGCTVQSCSCTAATEQWASTTDYFAYQALTVHFDGGSVEINDKACCGRQVRAVRGGL